MPLVESSAYQPPFFLFNNHVETIMPSIFRTVPGSYTRERIELHDGDFLDLDWFSKSGNKLVIVSHGLEGNSERHYAKGMAAYFFKQGWDAVAWNCRGCSGEINRLPRFYHHGATDDLAAVVDYAVEKNYKHIALVGFSMGGSMTLKYLGEQGIHTKIKSATVFSVPCHLGSSASELEKPANKFYLQRFLKKLEKKMLAKSHLFPELISIKGFKNISSFREFDNRYTAPLHGFADADDFYSKASCGPYLSTIQTPALIVNAINDPFLPEACYPYALAKDHASVHLETPNKGGHVGFSLKTLSENWMEKRAFEFINAY
ncbi:MAG: alpha/beta fold hydrolase [Cytophagales bacterium]|nr:alpha/beta fold hydrolase [Cytophagales bacterium]